MALMFLRPEKCGGQDVAHYMVNLERIWLQERLGMRLSMLTVTQQWGLARESIGGSRSPYFNSHFPEVQ